MGAVPIPLPGELAPRQAIMSLGSPSFTSNPRPLPHLLAVRGHSPADAGGSSGQHGTVIAGAPDTPDMNTAVLRGRGGCPYLLQQCRRAAGLAAQDVSQVLGTCGVEPYSEAFRNNVGMQDELSEQLSTGL
jgi:hypothetical protein